MDSSGSSDMSSNNSGDAEGVWSPDIDQAFHEALQIYPPCGRRKIIVNDEGKMYGRNELIARYIKIRCGKTRTRKQVSSHIQVLARKKQRESQSKNRIDNTFIIPNEAQGLNSMHCMTAESSPNSHMHLAIPNSSHYNTSPPSSASSSLNSYNLFNPTSSSIGRFDPPVDNPNTEQQFQNPSWSCNTSTNNPFTNSCYNPLNDENQLYLAALLKILPLNGLNFIVPKAEHNDDSAFSYTGSQPANLPTLVASSKLILYGFTAYIEQGNSTLNSYSRFEIIKIPRSFDEPFESIKIEEIFPKYPSELQLLFEKGPTDSFFLAKCWANIAFDIQDFHDTIYAVDSFYKSGHKCEISVSTKVCSLDKQLVEKVEVYPPTIEDEEKVKDMTLYNFRLEKSPICDMVVQFIRKLKDLNDIEEMNCILDNFTILQVVTDKHSNETLMVVCFMFEISPESESSTRVYKLTR